MGTIMLNGIAYGGDNFFRLKQEEYDALTPYEQTHGNYCITDAGATGDLAGNYVTYTSGDVADADATSWSTVQPMESREGFAGLFNKISTMAKNVRYLYKMLGNTDLSAISDGTVTKAISDLYTPVLITSGTGYTIYRCGKIVNVAFSSYPASSALNISNLPKPSVSRSIAGTLINGTTIATNFLISTNGTLQVGATSITSYGSTSYITSD